MRGLVCSTMKAHVHVSIHHAHDHIYSLHVCMCMCMCKSNYRSMSVAQLEYVYYVEGNEQHNTHVVEVERYWQPSGCINASWKQGYGNTHDIIGFKHRQVGGKPIKLTNKNQNNKAGRLTALRLLKEALWIRGVGRLYTRMQMNTNTDIQCNICSKQRRKLKKRVKSKAWVNTYIYIYTCMRVRLQKQRGTIESMELTKTREGRIRKQKMMMHQKSITKRNENRSNWHLDPRLEKEKCRW